MEAVIEQLRLLALNYGLQLLGGNRHFGFSAV